MRPTRARPPWSCAAADIAHRYTDKPVYVRATAIRTRDYGAYEVHTTLGRVDEDASPRCTRPRPHSRRPGIGPEDVDVIQLQDTDAGAEVIHMAENGFCADGEQEKLIADGATEIDGPCRSTPTAASSPTASRSAPPGCGRCTSSCSSCAAGRRPPGAGRPQGRLRAGLRRTRDGGGTILSR